MFAEDDIERRRVEREAADRAYNEALTALDQAFPRMPELPHPPVVYDESRLPAINERWEVVPADPAPGASGWRRRAARLVWGIVRPAFERQQAFNSALVDHLNRNVAVHRANREAIAAAIETLRGELEKLQAFHSRLVMYLQTITRFVDTKDRSEHIARLANITQAGLSGVVDEFRRDWEAMTARDQRHVAAVDELRTSIAAVQQTGLTLKRELERLLAGRPAPAEAGAAAAGPAQPGAAPAGGAQQAKAARPAPGAGAVPPAADAVNAYKYVGFENKFRGSEPEIRARLEDYVGLFAGASDVLDLGCGRGEFLALLAERGIAGRGLDINHEMVELCRAQGLEAREGDALAYLESLADGALGGLIAVQVVEHFQPAYLVRLLDAAFHKLRPGSRIVLETLNPACWFAFFDAYIRDITHAWPLHPETLKYLVVASGFQRADVRMLSPYPADARLQPLWLPPGADALAMTTMAQVFNENMAKLNAVMFSELDYAVIAERM
ncbi:MAG TPA: class I SAM-dependent methyltransferase [Vicinamibacterales bacterium]|nr:class I SAM-dependent methyltransferase [Vicinamibacterales bacterium]HPW21639.1 class I SAM-dependent methyltransferase [Vicinamibacterales bacterium]